ncbi:P-loop NTPase [Lentzea sp. NPDC055074]
MSATFTDASWARDLAELQLAVARRNRGGSAGGRAAVSGLAYQAHVALLDAVRAHSSATGSSPELRYEHLSDFSLADDTTLVTCQVKQRLNEPSLRKALDELFGIHLAGREFVPEVVPRLRYRIIHAGSNLQDARAVTSKWAQQRSEEQDAAEEMAKALEIREEREPLGELLALLAREFQVQKPRELVDRWVGRIFAEASERQTMSTEISMDLDAATADEDLPFTVLLPDDREPDVVEVREGGFLVGEEPRLHHLRDGFFAPSPQVSSLESEFWDWHEATLSNGASSSSGAVPMFWIQGPSGSGKSILLLQLLALVNQRPGISVLWLGSNIESLPEAVQFGKQLGSDRRVVIGVDDPFVMSHDDDSDQNWRKAMAKLSTIRQRGDTDSLPVILCCGPREQLRRFQDRHGGDVALRTHLHAIPSAGDVDVLRNWYRARTGDDRELPPAESNMLPAQLFFEWWKSEGIRLFARRFRARMRRLGNPALVDFVDRVLALNRIYVGYPRQLMDRYDEQLLDHVAALEHDLHFTKRSSGRAGYWLTHPHLSTILYDTWHRPGEAANVRAAHLRNAMLQAIRADSDGLLHHRLLSTLLGFLDPLKPTAAASAGRVSRSDAENAVRAAIDAVGDGLAQLAPSALATWVRVEIVAPLCMGRWQPTSEALVLLSTADLHTPGLATLLHALVEGGRPDAVRRVREIVAHNPRWDGWVLLMTRLLSVCSVADLADDVVSGVSAAPEDPERVQLLADFLSRAPETVELRQQARVLLDERDEPAAPLGSLAELLVSGSPVERKSSLRWLTRRLRCENGPALVKALQDPRSPLEVLHHANMWLLEYPQEKTAGLLFARTLTWHKIHKGSPYISALRSHLDTVTNSAAVDVILSMLTRDPEHVAWSYLFGTLSQTHRAQPETRLVGVNWLTEYRDAAGWVSVFVRLAQAVQGVDTELVDLGESHLPLVADTAEWPYLMNLIFSMSPPERMAELSVRSAAWLDGHSDSDGGWGYLLQSVLRCAPVDSVRGVVEMALRWLRDRQDSVAWSYVWLACVLHERQHEQDALIALAADWLTSDRSGWRHVFLPYRRIVGDQDAVLDLARPWLENNYATDDWPAVFSVMAPALGRADTARMLARWFDTDPAAVSSVGYLWKVLIEDGLYPLLNDEPAVLASTIRWLQRNPQVNSWWHVWRTLYIASPLSRPLMDLAVTAEVTIERSFGLANRIEKTTRLQPEIIEVALASLRANPHGASWFQIWMAVSVEPIPLALRSIGLDWISEGSPEFFAPVWKRLWETVDDEGERSTLEDVGLAWCRTHLPHPSWGSVWYRLATDSSPERADDIRALGQVWLDDPLACGRSKHRQRISEAITQQQAS